MKCLLVLGCFLPVLIGRPSPFHGISDLLDWSSGKKHDCAEHLHGSCVMKYLSPPLGQGIKPSFETCHVFDLMNCLEREINSTADCHHDANLNHTRIRSVQFNFVKAKKCPCVEDFDNLIKMLIDGDSFMDPDAFFIHYSDGDEDEYWFESGDEEGHDTGYVDSVLDFDESWVGKVNATRPYIEKTGHGDYDDGDENDTKGVLEGSFSSGDIDALKINETYANDTHDSIQEDMDGFITDLADVFATNDEWDDGVEDNEDDSDDESVHPFGEDSHTDHGETGHDVSMTDFGVDDHYDGIGKETPDNGSERLFDSSNPESSSHLDDSTYKDHH